MSALSLLHINDLRPRLSVKPNPPGYMVSRRPRLQSVLGVTIHYNGPALPFIPNAARELEFVVTVDTPNHQSRLGADSLQYHFVVLSDGSIWLTRNLEFIAWHCGNALGNERHIAIHLPLGVGQQPTQAQWASVVALVEALRADYSFNRNSVAGHCEWPRGNSAPFVPSNVYKLQPGQSACPGPIIHRMIVEYRNAPVEAVGLAVAAAPRISEATFVRVLTEAKSPAAGVAAPLYRVAVEEGIDPAVALAFFKHESTFGTLGICKDYDTKNWGNVRTPEEAGAGIIIATRGGNFVKYPTWEAGLRDWCRRLKGPKYAGEGRTTVESIIPKYAPGSQSSIDRYVQVIRELVDAWQKQETPANGWFVVITADTLNIRQGAHTKYPIAGQLHKGDRVLVDSTKDEGQGEWLHLADQRGFIKAEFTTRS